MTKTKRMEAFEDKVIGYVRDEKRLLYTFLTEYDTLTDTYEDCVYCMYITKVYCNFVFTYTWYKEEYVQEVIHKAQRKIEHYKRLVKDVNLYNLLQSTWEMLMALGMLTYNSMLPLVRDVVQGDRLQRAIPSRI